MTKLAFLLAPIIASSLELNGDWVTTSSICFLPAELFNGYILKYATPSSLLLLSMTSKEFLGLAEEELYSRCTEHFCELFEEQRNFLKDRDWRICSLESFIRRAWPKSNLLLISSMLDSTLKFIFESLLGNVTPLQLYPYKHPEGFPSVTLTVLKMKLTESIQVSRALLDDVPWKIISNFADGNIHKLNNHYFLHLGFVYVIEGKFDILEAIITDQRIGSKLIEIMPFSPEFLMHVISTKSLETTLEHFNFISGRNFVREMIYDANLPINTMIDLFSKRIIGGQNGEWFVAKLLECGYEPDLGWFNDQRLFDQRTMKIIWRCLENSDIDSLNDETISMAVLYIVVKGMVGGKPVTEVQSEIKHFLGDRDFKASKGLHEISYHFWRDLPYEQRHFFADTLPENGRNFDHFKVDQIFSKYDRGILNKREFTSILNEVIDSTFSRHNTVVSEEHYEDIFIYAEKLGLLQSFPKHFSSQQHLTMYLSKKPITELMASISQIKNLANLQNLDYFVMRALLMKEGGIQVLRQSLPDRVPVLLEIEYIRTPQATLDKWLDWSRPDFFVFIDHFLFDRQPSFKVRVAEDWPRQRRLRLDLALTKATNLYPVNLQIKSLKMIGIDKDNLLSMYMVRALMSTPEGREAAQGLISEEDLEMAIMICAGVAPYF